MFYGKTCLYARLPVPDKHTGPGFWLAGLNADTPVDFGTTDI
jgi:hypothetical protein